jgi:hypothetical protein
MRAYARKIRTGVNEPSKKAKAVSKKKKRIRIWDYAENWLETIKGEKIMGCKKGKKGKK